MKFKNCLCTLIVGAMMAFTYEQIKNGNMKKLISKCKNMEIKMGEDLENMMQIKAIFTKPLTILKSIYFNICGINQDLATKRLKICGTCSHKLQTSIGEVCDECGCILQNKTRIEDEHCDLCKW